MDKPYITLSEFLKGRFGEKVFKVSLEAGFTCPNRDGSKGTGGCIYCNSETLVPLSYTGEDIKGQILAGMEKVRRRHNANKFIAYFQINSNTYAPIDYLKKVYREALLPDIVGLAVSTRPDCVDYEVLDLLKELKKERFLWLELGLQTANDSTLLSINRGHTASEFKDAVEKARRSGIDVCAHVIIGLPDETRDDMLGTARFLADSRVWGVKFHQLQVLKDTPLLKLYEEGKVKTLSLDEYASIVADSLMILPPSTVIHRLSGDAPLKYLVAPRWGANKFIVAEQIERLLKLRIEVNSEKV
ncbi:MAG: TIGR01212 family radical SAM protein [Deltaproteobacteria bacterium]|nr:TIGR01212 family radical SAM protein [Deltaproteobacteria bacterium]